MWPHFRHVAKLTVILTNPDPAITALIPHDVRVLDRVPWGELITEMSRTDIFVLPSLVEGFGLVLTEALGLGCYVVGTTHTGLPDLCLPSWCGSHYEAGDLAALEHELETAIRVAGQTSRDEKNHVAQERSWTNFRSNLRAALGHEA